MLLACGNVGKTPSDIFNNILLGRAIILDHGFNLVPGFRTISIYSHLSFINNNIVGGLEVTEGQIIGRTGNSGTRQSTLGTKKEAHLHWEMILQNNENEIFLGQGMNFKELYTMLENIFKDI